MKASMYFNYTSRSLLRGGLRTLLAVFCVAVGVMAIVALQLVGSMLQNSLTSSTRDTNGGDIAVTGYWGKDALAVSSSPTSSSSKARAPSRTTLLS